jgi:hemoglobin
VATTSLYERLGDLPTVSTVVAQFITNVVAETMMSNSKLERTFDLLVQSDNSYCVASLRNQPIDQIGQATGGLLVYEGLSMPAAHRGMNIREVKFNALVPS